MTAFATSYLVGLDLGPAGDPSALAVIEAHEQDRGGAATDRRLALRHLHRWPRGVGYAEIGRDLSALLANPPLAHATLVVDQTAVGRPVVDLVRDQARPECLVRVTVTGGHRGGLDRGGHTVPRTELISVVQAALQSRRLRFAARLPYGDLLLRELQEYRVRPAVTTEEMIDWRQGPEDDLVFAVALACWRAERRPCAGVV